MTKHGILLQLGLLSTAFGPHSRNDAMAEMYLPVTSWFLYTETNLRCRSPEFSGGPRMLLLVIPSPDDSCLCVLDAGHEIINKIHIPRFLLYQSLYLAAEF